MNKIYIGQPPAKMKIIRIALVLLASLYMSFNVMAQKASSVIVDKEWILDFDATYTALKQARKDRIDTMRVEIKNAIRASLDARSVLFKNDGAYETTLKDGKVFKGSWELLSDKKTLEITLEDGHIFRQRIQRLSAAELTLRVKEKNDPNALIHVWHFKVVSE